MIKKPEVKTFALKLDAPPDDEGRFTGYAAVFGNVDKGNDVIEPGAFTKTLQENPDVPILWAHDVDEPIGVSTYMVEDGKGLKVEGQLAMDVQRAREVHSLMKIGAIKGLSIGYNTMRRYFKGQVRHLQELALGEFSPVVFPMNTLAGVDGVKGRKWLGQYGTTECVDCLLSMIGSGTDFLAHEVEHGDAQDAERMQTVISTLVELVGSEIDQVAAGETDDEEPDYTIWIEEMRDPVEHSIKKLQALLEKAAPDPGSTQPAPRAAAPNAAPDVVSTLRDLQSSMRVDAPAA